MVDQKVIFLVEEAQNAVLNKNSPDSFLLLW